MVQAKIDLKKAIAASKASASELLGWTKPVIEEIERDTYKKHDCWSITFSQNGSQELFGLNMPIPQYKRFLVDTQTGEVLAMVIRELATR